MPTTSRQLGRRSERAALDLLVSAVLTGESQALVVRGEAGVGKSALLDYVDERAAGCRIVHAIGVEAEMELVFAGAQRAAACGWARRTLAERGGK